MRITSRKWGMNSLKYNFVFIIYSNLTEKSGTCNNQNFISNQSINWFFLIHNNLQWNIIMALDCVSINNLGRFFDQKKRGSPQAHLGNTQLLTICLKWTSNFNHPQWFDWRSFDMSQLTIESWLCLLPRIFFSSEFLLFNFFFKFRIDNFLFLMYNILGKC